LNPSLKTQRLRLREWRDDDLAPFATMNADPAVMEFLPSTLSRVESDAFAGRIRAHFDEHIFGLWAVEEVASGSFIGFVGLSVPHFDIPFMPCVEIGWRLARDHWGRGYATEAAMEAIKFGFERAELAEIVSFTVPMNQRSRGVMTKLGLQREAKDDFEHPSLPVGHRLRSHVLYRLESWRFRAAAAERQTPHDAIRER
jgi:RimJ/RimL family protein N-acetyltransferase